MRAAWFERYIFPLSNESSKVFYRVMSTFTRQFKLTIKHEAWGKKSLWVVSGSSEKKMQECMQAGYLTANHVSLPLLAGRLKTLGSLSGFERWCFVTKRILRKWVKIGTQDVNCIANISCEFGKFCKKNGKVIAQRIGPFLPARLLFACALERASRGGGVVGAL